MYLKQTMFLGYIMLQLFRSHNYARRNAISNVECFVILHLYFPQYVCSAHHGITQAYLCISLVFAKKKQTFSHANVVQECMTLIWKNKWFFWNNGRRSVINKNHLRSEVSVFLTDISTLLSSVRNYGQFSPRNVFRILKLSFCTPPSNKTFYPWI
jgi:hypothetical protein